MCVGGFGGGAPIVPPPVQYPTPAFIYVPSLHKASPPTWIPYTNYTGRWVYFPEVRYWVWTPYYGYWSFQGGVWIWTTGH